MDIYIPIALILIFFILFSVCGWCCKRHREGTVYGHGGIPVTVTTQHVNASPVVVPPYPIDARHPTPQAMPPAPTPGFQPPQMGYQATPYPPTAPGFYCPPPMGAYPPTSAAGGYPPTPYQPNQSAPYPPAQGAPYGAQGGGGSYGAQSAPPPSYTEAVGQPMPHPPTNELYAKQSPYNPNF